MRARLVLVAAALAAFASPAAQRASVGFDGKVDARVETGYLSSSGTLLDTRPVAEQQLDATLHLAEYGRLTACGWVISALHGGRDDINRRAFYLYESMVGYGYDFAPTAWLDVVNEAGFVWDSPWGYKDYSQEEVAWWFRQSAENPVLVPYIEAIGLFAPDRWLRVALGVRRGFAFGGAFVLTPAVETVWGDAARFDACYGELPAHRFLGGAFMTLTPGFRLDWNFADGWTLWFRFREFITVDPQARRIVGERTAYFDQNEAEIFTLGLSRAF